MRIGQLKVIFTLPQQILEGSSGSIRLTGLPQAPLGYVEWYSKLKPAAEKNHLMYKITRPPPHADGSVPGAVIPLTDIRQSCQLIPKFTQGGSLEEGKWRSETVLDQATTFYVNNWSGLYAYQTIW